MTAERCNRCGGEFVPAVGLVPLWRCVSCGREVPAPALERTQMPDASGNFKGMAVPADAWERIFARNPNGCVECSGACGECLSIDASDLTEDEYRNLVKFVGGTD